MHEKYTILPNPDSKPLQKELILSRSHPFISKHFIVNFSASSARKETYPKRRGHSEKQKEAKY